MLALIIFIGFIVIFFMALMNLRGLSNASDEERLGVKAALLISGVIIILFLYKGWRMYQASEGFFSSTIE